MENGQRDRVQSEGCIVNGKEESHMFQEMELIYKNFLFEENTRVAIIWSQSRRDGIGLGTCSSVSIRTQDGRHA